MYSKTLATLILLLVGAVSVWGCDPPDPIPPSNCQGNIPRPNTPAPKPPTNPNLVSAR